MIVDYNFNSSWDSSKKERVSSLLSERILLLMGIKVFEKIESIRFCEKEWIEDNLFENSYILLDSRLAAMYTDEERCTETFELVLEKDILLSMLTPGAGQSVFDDMILKLGNVIQSN